MISTSKSELKFNRSFNELLWYCDVVYSSKKKEKRIRSLRVLVLRSDAPSYPSHQTKGYVGAHAEEEQGHSQGCNSGIYRGALPITFRRLE